MGKMRRLQPVAVALLLAFFLSSCGGTPRKLFGKRHKPVNGVAPVLKVATRDELNAIVARTFDAIHSFSASSVNLIASKGSIYQGQILDYPSLSGVILFRKPDIIRVQAHYPLVGTVLDMVSTGADFKLFMPTKNIFVEGLNSAPADPSASQLEKLRPGAFLSSMLIRPWDPATESVMLKDDTDEDDALYRLEFNLKAQDGSPIPGREIWFDRLDLSIARQKEYDKDGSILSDTSYSKWQVYSGVSFPAHIDLSRPKDGYGVAIDIIKIDMNKPITDQQLVLERPEGSTLKEIK
jgi:hypothetical protein